MSLQVKLGNVIRYATSTHEELVAKAVTEFTRGDPIEADISLSAKIEGLVGEWLVFDYQLPNGNNFVTEYYLRNPDSWSQSLLKELREIIDTQYYDYLEVVEIKRGEWIKLYSFTKGRVIKVWDVAGSMSMRAKSTITGRPAKVRGRWYLVGDDGIQFPVYTTARHKRFLRQAKTPFKFTPKHTLQLLISSNSAQSRREKIYSKKEIKAKRKELKEEYNGLLLKYVFGLEFDRLVQFVYRADYKSNFADMFKDLVKLGVPEEVIINSSQLFQDLWNFLPHKALKGKCPQEMYQELYLAEN